MIFVKYSDKYIIFYHYRIYSVTSINSILIYTNIWAYLSFIFSYVLVTFIFLFCIYSFIL